jgi:toluene monooxygenase system ferredoxin subunit
MPFQRVCAEDDLDANELTAFFVDDCEVLVLRDASGTLRAMDGICPHEQFSLALGGFDGTVIVCANHMWSFDATTGKGISNPSCQLEQYPLKVEDGEVFVDVEVSADMTG